VEITCLALKEAAITNFLVPDGKKLSYVTAIGYYFTGKLAEKSKDCMFHPKPKSLK